MAALARNASNRLRLVNVWATWGAPCVAEFSALVSLSRRLSNRDFELVTISLDDPKTKAQAFLAKQPAVPSARRKRALAAEGRETVNFISTAASSDA